MQVAGDVDDLLAGHHVLTGPTAQLDAVLAALRRRARAAGRTAERAARPRRAAARRRRSGWQLEPTNLEELVLAYLRVPSAHGAARPARSSRGWRRHDRGRRPHGRRATAISTRRPRLGDLAPAPDCPARRAGRCSAASPCCWSSTAWPCTTTTTGSASTPAVARRPCCQNALERLHRTATRASPSSCRGCCCSSPALLGAFVGAPLVARELETGTFRFAWTQGTDRRDLDARQAGCCSAPRWSCWRSRSRAVHLVVPAVRSDPRTDRRAAQAYEVEGIVFAARMLFGFALGALLGALIRRTVPAMAATLAVWLGVVFIDGDLPPSPHP